MSLDDELIERSVSRYHRLFDLYDRVICCCSGGKDSTVIVEVGVIAAARYGTRLQVWFFDEELIPDKTIQYMQRMQARDDLDFRWYCIPYKEINGFSKENPTWRPWEPGKTWSRPLPEGALTEIPGFTQDADLSMTTQLEARDAIPQTTAIVIGRRAAESPARRVIASSSGWITGGKGNAPLASVIVDWSNEDVWRVIENKRWDYNRVYIDMHRAGVTRLQLRVGPLFGEESSMLAPYIAKYDPALWKRAQLRLPGISNLARYSLTSVMGRGRVREDGKVTVGAIKSALAAHAPEKRKDTARSIRRMMENILLMRTQIPGKEVLRIALRGDTKADRMQLKRTTRAAIKTSEMGKYRIDKGNRAETVLISARLQRRKKDARRQSAVNKVGRKLKVRR